MIRTDEQILQDCIKRASYAVNRTNNPDTRMVLDALIEKQIRDEKVERLQAKLTAAISDFESAAHGGNLCEFCCADCIDAGEEVADTFQCGRFGSGINSITYWCDCCGTVAQFYHDSDKRIKSIESKLEYED